MSPALADYTQWGKTRISDLLLAVEMKCSNGAKIKITSIPKISGSAYVNTRKGKVFAGYEFKIATFDWQGELNGFKGTGKASFPEISPDVSKLDYEVRAITLEGADDADKSAVLDAFRKEVIPVRSLLKICTPEFVFRCHRRLPAFDFIFIFFNTFVCRVYVL